MSDTTPEEASEAEQEPVVHPPFSVGGLQQRFGERQLSVTEFRGEITMVVPEEHLLEVCRDLRDDPEYRFNACMDMVAIDHLPRQPRFDVNYHLNAIPEGRWMRVKVMLSAPNPSVESVTSVWSSANWMEREIYDLMGVVFTGHPDLRRIMMSEEWEGHPHRRDYPTGKQPVTFTPPPPGTLPGT